MSWMHQQSLFFAALSLMFVWRLAFATENLHYIIWINMKNTTSVGSVYGGTIRGYAVLHNNQVQCLPISTQAKNSIPEYSRAYCSTEYEDVKIRPIIFLNRSQICTQKGNILLPLNANRTTAMVLVMEVVLKQVLLTVLAPIFVWSTSDIYWRIGLIISNQCCSTEECLSPDFIAGYYGLRHISTACQLMQIGPVEFLEWNLPRINHLALLNPQST